VKSSVYVSWVAFTGQPLDKKCNSTQNNIVSLLLLSFSLIATQVIFYYSLVYLDLNFDITTSSTQKIQY